MESGDLSDVEMGDLSDAERRGDLSDVCVWGGGGGLSDMERGDFSDV